MIDPRNDCPVVVGMGPAGLFLVRQLKRLGCPVSAIARPGDVGIPTNAVSRGAMRVVTERADVVSALDAIDASNPGRCLRLCIASDQYLTLLLTLSDSSLRSYGMKQGEIDSYRLVNDKTRLEKALSTRSLVPETYLVKKVPSDAYPCVVKWNEKRVSVSSHVLPKVGIVRDGGELGRLITGLMDEGFSERDVIVQRYVSGNNALQYSFGGYYQNGDLLAGLCVNQARQYPQGISSCVIEAHGAEADCVKAAALSIARGLSFTGFLEVECKLDRTRERPLVLDVNPRPWGWVSILGKKYPDFHRALLGERPRPIEQSVVWRTLPRDLLAGRNGQNVRLSTRGYVRCTDILDRADVLPFLGLGIAAARKVFCR